MRDLHFRVEGPVVAQLQEVFVDDWLFATGEELRGADWFPPLSAAGGLLAQRSLGARLRDGTARLLSPYL